MNDDVSDDESSEDEYLSEIRMKKEMEAAHEVQRLKVFDDHTRLIAPASDLDFKELKNLIEAMDPLTRPSMRFSDSQNQGLPASGGTNLFEVIHNNPRLNSTEKCDLMYALIEKKGYDICGGLVMRHPYIDHFLKNDRHLAKLYFRMCGDPAIKRDTELAIWRKIYDGNNGFDLLLDLMASQDRSSTLLSYVDFWLNALNNPDEVAEAYKIIKAYDEYHVHKRLRYIKELAELRILQLGLTETADLSNEASKFLKTAHCRLFSCAHARTPYDIYKLKHKDIIGALSDYRDEKDTLEKKINTKLSKCAYSQHETRVKLLR